MKKNTRHWRQGRQAIDMRSLKKNMSSSKNVQVVARKTSIDILRERIRSLRDELERLLRKTRS